MNTLASPSELTLRAQTAAHLMVENPVSIDGNASIHEAAALFTTKGFSAAPVIDNAGRPIGVISCSDIIIHERANNEWGFGKKTKVELGNASDACVCDVMTPAVFSVSPDTTVARVVHEMLALKVHRLFVVDAASVLVGVISALDVLRHLHH